MGYINPLSYRGTESVLEYTIPTVFSLLVSVLETVSANYLQGKDCSGVDSVHPVTLSHQGNDVHTCGVMLKYASPVDYFVNSEIPFEMLLIEKKMIICSFLVSKGHHKLRRLVATFSLYSERSFTSDLLKQ